MIYRLIKYIKKRPLPVWIVMAVCILTSLVAFAAYDEANSVMRRVIVASEGKKADFTSNYLAKGAEGVFTHRTLYRNVSQDLHYETDMVIRNYDPDAQDYPYEMDIEYTLNVQLTDANGNAITDFSRFFAEEDAPASKTLTVKSSSGDALCEFTITSTTTGAQAAAVQNQKIEYVKGRPGELKYKLDFKNWLLESDTDLCIKLVANLDRETSGTRYADLEDIGAVLGLAKNQEAAQNGWRASVSEIEQSITGAVGYNLILTGSGRSDITIKWDTDRISLNELFRGTETVFDLRSGEVEFTNAPKKTDSESTDSWATLIVHADANLDRSGEAGLGEYRNYYNIQVYSTGVASLDDSFFEVLENGAARSEGKFLTVSIGE